MSRADRGVALVTGAGQRVGQAIALELGERGWSIAVHHHGSVDGASETVDRIVAAGGAARAFRADLRRAESAPELIAEVVEGLGRLDLLVNSAAGMVRTPFGAITADRFDDIMALNLRAPFLLAQAAAGVMREGSVIVNISDHMAHEPWPDFLVHGVSKAGVDALTRHLAAALAPRVRVNAVAPGFVLAPLGMPADAAAQFAAQTPMQRVGTAADVAQAVAYLIDAPYVTGETLHVDGGRGVRR